LVKASNIEELLFLTTGSGGWVKGKGMNPGIVNHTIVMSIKDSGGTE
jgi:hypothetical protein